MCEKYGIHRVGFLTLTIDPKQAYREGWNPKFPKDVQKRWHSLRTHVISPRYGGRWLRVIERHKSSRLHYHVLVVVDGDIRTGHDFKKFAENPMASVNDRLKKEWKFLGHPKRPGALQKHGFGRCSLEPIRSTEEAIGKYVGKYIEKHIEKRVVADKGVRLVEFGKTTRMGTTEFSWNSEGAKLWRAKGQVWEKEMFEATGYGHGTYNFQVRSGPCRSRDNFGILKALFGPKWAYAAQEAIMQTEVPDYCHPSLEAAERYCAGLTKWKSEIEVEVILEKLKKQRPK
jgi:hypothetical protein